MKFLEFISRLFDRGVVSRTRERWRARIGKGSPSAYLVEHVLLVHNDTGLLLQHVSAPGTALDNGYLIASMLSALSTFVGGRFNRDDRELRAFAAGELTVLVERGPIVSLVAVVRGQPAETLPPQMQNVLATLSQEQAETLELYREPDRCAPLRPYLELCLNQARRLVRH